MLHDAVASLSMEVPEDAAFVAELQSPMEDEPRYVLSVRPVGPLESVHQQLTLVATFKDGGRRAFPLHARVVAAEREQAGRTASRNGGGVE